MAMIEPRTADDAAPPEDFGDFYRREWPAAVRLAGLLTHNSKTGEDLAQDAFTRVYPKWSRVENPHAYLRTAIVNTCRQWHARGNTERTKLPLLAERAPHTFELDGLDELIGELPYRQRVVLVLRYHTGLSESEIADALGCRPGTVKSLASRALATLKKGIEE